MIEEHGREIDIQLGHEQLVIQRKYEAAGAVNDLLIAVWFLVGSVFFLDDSLMRSGTWLFVIGSTQFLLKPVIKLAGLVHMRRFVMGGRAAVKVAEESSGERD